MAKDPIDSNVYDDDGAGGRIPRVSIDQSFGLAEAYSLSDTGAVAAGKAIAVVATSAGNVSVALAKGGTFVFPVPVGLTILPLAVSRVNSTGTTATGTFTKLA